MRVKIVLLLALLVVCLFIASISVAAPDQPAAFELSWWTIDGGGRTSSGGAYVLSGTIGQPDMHCASNGSYLITGGFWSGAMLRCHRVFLPLILKQ